MPSPADILSGLTRIANEWILVAVVWHLLVAVAVGAVLGGWRPSTRLAALATAAPLASVSLFAWLAGNPFNGLVLGVGAVGVAVVALRLPSSSVAFASPVVRGLGAAMLVFAWLYPHFLERPVWFYLFAAPVGLVPCPSLSLVLGAGLCLRGFGSRAWSIAVGVLGAFYGVFGVARLGVWLDLPLIAAALLVLVLPFTAWKPAPGMDSPRHA